jgi:subtilase family serine protease
MRSRLVCSLILPIAIVFTVFTPVAQAAGQNRIAGAVSGSNRIPLPGNISGHAKYSTDLGLAPADRKLDSLSLRFSMTPAQQADLNQLQAAQLDPSSPNYHQWLTSEQFGARFGLSASDLAKVSAWLTSQGFTITSVAKSSTFINFTGTVAQVQQALGTAIHTVSYNGEQHISNLTEPTLPAAISGVVLAVSGLNDFKAKPHSISRNLTTNPQFSTASCPGVTGPCHFIAPSDFYTIYDFPPSSSNLNGAGITIAVMGQTDITQGNILPDANVTAFRTAAGLPAINLKLQLAGPTDPGISASDIDEAHIDVEWSGAAAPGANIDFIYSPDAVDTSLFFAIDASPTIAPIITISYGLCESLYSASMRTSINQILQMANTKGITVMSSAGDSGATDCDTTGIATEGLAVDFPGSSPYVTSAGGTMFNDTSNPTAYWNSGTGSAGSAIKYIPELPWNEASSSTGLSQGAGAGGGGASGFFSKPAWQVGLGVPNDSSRDTPDVSLNAAALHDGYVACSQGSCTNGFLGSTGQPNSFGGTSFVAPTLAGILALVEQHLGTGGLGNIGPTLYGLASGPTASSIFHDIITGNNSIVCAQGTPNCPNGGSIGYNAGTGYDQATGLGSLDVNMLVTNWASAVPAGTGGTVGSGITTTSLTTTTSLCALNSSTISLTATVASITSGTPTGTVQFFIDNQPVGTSQPLVNGAVTAFALTVPATTSGGHNVSAVYSGDTNFAGSKGTILASDGTFASVDFVSTSQKDFTFTSGTCSNSITVSPGATSSGLVFTITPVNGFTGAVSMTAVPNDLGNFTPSFSVTPVNITSSTGVTTSFVLKASTTTAGLTKPSLTPFEHPSGKTPWFAAGSGATLACVLLFLAPRRRRWGALLAVLISVAALTAIGCGGTSTSTTGGSGTGGGGGGTGTTNAQPGTYVFTVTAVSGTVVHSAQVTVNVP